MRILKWLGVGAGVLLGLFIVTVVLVVLFVDPNDYKDDIERLAEQQTGRQLELAGDLKLSVFPWLAIEFGPASLSDAPGFGDEPFVAVQHARLSVRFWPLLRGAIEIGDIRFDGVIVRLITDAAGRENWADLAATETDPGPETQPAGESLAMPTIAGLEIRDAAIVLEDRRDDSRLRILELNLETGRLKSGEPFELDSDFLLETANGLSASVSLTANVTADLAGNVHVVERPAIEATLRGEGMPAEGVVFKVRADNARIDVGQEQHTLEGLLAETAWRGEGFPAEGVPVTLHATALQADLASQTLKVDGLDVDAAGARLTGALTGVEVLDAPRLEGQLVLAPVSMREWLPKLGMEVPVTRDAAVLQKLAFTARVALTSTSADFAELVLELDDTTARGSVGLADFERQAVRFDLDVDRIEVDRYLPPEAPEDDAATADSAPVEIPVEALRQLNARGTLDIGEAVFAGIRFTKLRLGVTARDGDVRLNPVEAIAYGGQYRGDVGIAAAGDTPRVTLDQTLTDVDFAPLLTDLFKTQRLSGKGSFSSKLTATGRDTEALQKTLNGTLDFGVRDGALEGTDLWYEIRRARALLRQQAIPERTGARRTLFTALAGTGTVRNGVVDTRDLTMAMEYLRIAGSATLDLPAAEIDSRLEATVLRIPAEGTDTAGMEELVNARIPVRITGPFAEPSVRPDVEDYLKNRVRERVEEEKEKVEEKLRDTLQERLRKALGGNG